MSVEWYNLELVNNGNSGQLVERNAKSGRYGHRREIEPILVREEKRRKEEFKLLKGILGELDILKSHCKKTDQRAEKMCERIMDKLNGVMGV